MQDLFSLVAMGIVVDDGETIMCTDKLSQEDTITIAKEAGYAGMDFENIDYDYLIRKTVKIKEVDTTSVEYIANAIVDEANNELNRLLAEGQESVGIDR